MYGLDNLVHNQDIDNLCPTLWNKVKTFKESYKKLLKWKDYNRRGKIFTYLC